MEKREFPISRFSIIWGVAIRLILAVCFLIFYLDLKGLVLFLLACLFLIFTFYFLKRPYKIVTDGNEIVFRSLLFKPIRIDVDNLLSINDVGIGWLTKFNSKKKTLTTLSKIKNRDELFNYIHSLNSNIKMKQVSETRETLVTLGRILHTVITVIALFIVVVTLSLYIHAIGHRRSPNSIAKADVINTYPAAQAYFADHPNGVVTLPLLKKYRFFQSKGVKITIISGSKDSLKIEATHPKGDKIYEVVAKGALTFRKKE